MDDDDFDDGLAASRERLTRADGWQVSSIDSEVLDAEEPAPTLILDPDGTVTGSTGVNRIRGAYEMAESILEIGPLASTRMAGSSDAMEVEHHFLAVLSEPLAVRWDHATLVLESDEGQLRLEPGSDEISAADHSFEEPPVAEAVEGDDGDDLDDSDYADDADVDVELDGDVDLGLGPFEDQDEDV
jgi:heat shock protein HslJ